MNEGRIIKTLKQGDDLYISLVSLYACIRVGFETNAKGNNTYYLSVLLAAAKLVEKDNPDFDMNKYMDKLKKDYEGEPQPKRGFRKFFKGSVGHNW